MSADRGAIESITEALDDLAWNPYEKDDRSDAQRILDRLTADGWAVVRTGGWQHSVTEPLDPNLLPQPMSLDLCRRRITARRELTESSGADPSLMPVLLRRPLLVQLPWEPVPEGSEDA